MSLSFLRASLAGIAIGSMIMVVGCGDDHGVAPRPVPMQQKCIDFGEFLHLTGRLETPGSARRAVQNGNFVYVADGLFGLHVVDVGDPATPMILKTVATNGAALDVLAVDSLLYVATASAGVEIYDLVDAKGPLFVGGVATPGQVLGMAVKDTLLFIADDALGLQVINARVPSSPAIIGGENTPGQAQDVVVSGDHAFVSDLVLGFRSISISNPSAPFLLDTLAIPGQPGGLAIDGSTVYVASGSEGVQVVDVSQPDTPIIVGNVPMPGGTRDVDTSENRVYAADRFLGVQVVDITEPQNPSLLMSFDTSGEAIGVNVFGDLLYVSNPGVGFGGSVDVVDVSNPDPVPILSTEDTPGPAQGAFLVGEALYVCDGVSGVQVFDVSNAEAPRVAANIPLAGARHLAAHGGLAYVAMDVDGVGMIDVSDPFTPTVLPAVFPPAERVAAQDSLVYLARGAAGLSVFRVGPAKDPELFLNVESPFAGRAHDVVASTSHAFVAWGNAGLRVIDPTGMQVVGISATSGVARGIALADHYLLVAVGSAGLEIFDVQSPTAPVHITRVDTPGFASFVFARGQLAYVADGSGGVHAVGIGDPATATLVGSFGASSTVLGVTADEFFMYAVDRDDGLFITRAQCEGN